MTRTRRTLAGLLTAGLVASPLALVASPAAAADRDFRYGGADIDLEVDKDDGEFDIDVDIDDAKPGSRWRIVMKHDGKRFHSRKHRADGDGDVDVDKERPNTAGKDVFVITIKKVGKKKAATRTFRMQ